jgi:hypothetical protein
MGENRLRGRQFHPFDWFDPNCDLNGLNLDKLSESKGAQLSRLCHRALTERKSALLNLGMNLASICQIWETGCSQSPPNYSPAGIQERGLAPAAFKKSACGNPAGSELQRKGGCQRRLAQQFIPIHPYSSLYSATPKITTGLKQDLPKYPDTALQSD